MNDHARQTHLRLPSGRTLELTRSRWSGTLDREELDYCIANGIALAYDCAQIGWVTEMCTDDSQIAVPNERWVDLATYASPEQDARRLCDAVGSHAVRMLTDQATGAAALEQLRDSVAERTAEFYARHGVQAASRCHHALHALLARIAPPRHTEVEAGAGGEFSFRPWNEADAPDYRRMLDSHRLWEFLPESYPQPLTDETARTLIELSSIDSRQEALAILRDGKAVGQCLLRFHEPFADVRVAEVAYWLAEEHWGKGWMTRILPAFVARSFDNHDLDAIEAWIHERHTASVRVAERCHFRRDPFAFETELAAALSKQQARRFVIYRGEFASLRKDGAQRTRAAEPR